MKKWLILFVFLLTRQPNKRQGAFARQSRIGVYLVAGLISSFSLFGDCFDWEAGGGLGYRVDDDQYQILTELLGHTPIVKENWDWVQIFQVDAFAKFRFWRLEFYGEADYGWVQSGDVRTTLNFSDTLPATFSSEADGDVWDALGSGGIRFSFCCTRWSEFVLKPLGGYSYHSQSYKRRCITPPFERVAMIEDETTLVYLDPSERVKQHFNGPFIGGDFLIKNKGFISNFGYTYHWLDFKQQFALQNITEIIVADSTFTRATIQREGKFTSTHAFGHRGWLSFSYLFSNCWRFGARATYFYVKAKRTSAPLTTATTTQVLNALTPPATFILLETAQENFKWHSFTAMLEAAYSF